MSIRTTPILGTLVGEEHTFRALDGAVAATPMKVPMIGAEALERTLLRDALPMIRSTRSGIAPSPKCVICMAQSECFEDHTVISPSQTVDTPNEAFSTYLGCVLPRGLRAGQSLVRCWKSRYDRN